MLEKRGLQWIGDRPSLERELDHFARVIEQRPFDNRQGLRGVSAFALYYFIKQLQPRVVFEVGVWRGFGTWIIEQAAPDAKIYCFDPLFYLEHLIPRRRLGRVYRSEHATYLREDFSCADLSEIVDPKATVAIFDDHQRKLARLHQARQLGVRDIIFDDNTPYISTHRSLENELEHPTGRVAVETLVERYEVFPALWTVDHVVGPHRIQEPGLGFPVLERHRLVHADRGWHSYVTYLRLIDGDVANPSMPGSH